MRSLASWKRSRSEVATSDGPLLLLLGRDDGAHEVVRFVARRLRRREPERLDELRQQVELLEQVVLEDAAGLVRRERRVAIRRRVERVEADEHGTRLLLVPEPDEHVREADDHVRGPTLCAADLLRERVVRAMGERVAVDGEQRLHSVASSRAISAISRSVASCAASRGSAERRSSSGTGGPYATRIGPSRRRLSVPLIAAGINGTPAPSAMRAAPVCARGWYFLTRPFLAARPLREHHDDVPVAAELLRRLHRLEVRLPPVHLEGPARFDDRPERPPEELGLAHEPEEPPRVEGDPDRPGIEVREVVGGQDAAPFGRHVLDARCSSGGRAASSPAGRAPRRPNRTVRGAVPRRRILPS